jgi:hypothetical protein
LSTIQAPTLLRSLQGWLVWRFEHTAGEKKPRKVPYYINGRRRVGVQGSPQDRANMATFDAAKQFAIRRGFDGVGLALMPEFGVTALDFDDCVTPSGIDPQVETLTAGTYAEFSPSGNGLRAFVLGALGDNKDCVSETQPIGFETFTAKGFVTFTGNTTELTTLTGCENQISPVTEELTAFCATRFTRAQRTATPYDGSDTQPLGLTEEQISNLLASLPSDLAYDDWVRTGMAIHHETQGDGFGLWDEWSSTSPKYTSTEYSTERWVSFGINHSVAPFTARSLIRYAQELGCDPGINLDTASPDEFDALPPLPRSSAGAHGFYNLTDFTQQATSVRWLVKDFMPHAQLGVLFGESGAGKSFLMFDVCCAISQGKEWNGRRTIKARVLYVVAEGVSGFRQRIRAYCHQHNLQPSDLDIIVCTGVVPNLIDPASVNKLMLDIEQFGPFDLIVMDTFAQVTAGANENSGEDMGKALAHCRRIGQKSGAMVLLVHHSGKDASKGARGWSGLKAAADVELEVTRTDNMRAVRVSKLKDGRDGSSFGFKLLDVVLGTDEDGDDITSCIVEYGQVNQSQRKVKAPKGAVEKLVLSMAHEMSGLDQQGIIPQTELIAAAAAQIPHDSEKRDQRRAYVMRAITSLADGNWLIIGEGTVQIAAPENA